jgi:hypothetical protein
MFILFQIQFLAELFIGDSISLLFWSGDIGTIMGNPTKILGIMPNGLIPIEAIASLVCTRIT